MAVQARHYFLKDDDEEWDRLVAASWNGTFLHTRKFLSYHRERFQDASLVLEDGKRRILGVFPAAVDPAQADRIVSHPGITYGGIVHNGSLSGTRMLEALQSIAALYAQEGKRTLRYKAVPHIYHCIPAADDLYALFRLGAVRYRCDLSATIDLSKRPPPSIRRQRCLKKAQQAGVHVEQDARCLDFFWDILEENLWTKYGLRPVHSLTEIKRLCSLFQTEIECVVGKLEDQVVAGAILFKTYQVFHIQYCAANQQGKVASALDAVLEFCIAQSKANGIRFFNFGVSTEQDGMFLNEGLHQFKLQFGAGGVVHEFYELSLYRAEE